MKTIGILGGMGPEATVFFYEKIIKLTPAKKDQDHIPTVIYSNPQVPDRTECILADKHEEIIKVLQDSVKKVQEMDADFIVIPCNTSHYYIKEMRSVVKIPIIDMIEETAKYVKEFNVNKIGLLATTGTIKTKIYHDKFKEFNIDIIIPNEDKQKIVMDSIMNIKAGKLDYPALKEIADNLSDIIILGCTELPLAFKGHMTKNIIDPMDVLAKKAIEQAAD